MSAVASQGHLAELDGHALDRLLPMHVLLGADGRVRHAGPTFTRMCCGTPPRGQSFFDLLEIRSPGAVRDMPGLIGVTGQRLILALRAAPDLPLRGTAAELSRGGGVLLDISLGLSFERAVARFGLNVSDFSACDETVELLYLHEANAAIRHLSRQLTERLAAARAEAEALAMTDALTGLPNRRAMEAELTRSLAEPGATVALMHIDLDYFKRVNDTHGHAAGDRVLGNVAAILKDELRQPDMAARIGGDEFLVLLRDAAAPDGLAASAGRLIRRIEEPMEVRGAPCRLSASIGISATSAYRTSPSPRRIVEDADAALYRAKAAGRGRFAIHGQAEVPERPAAIDD
jgi:diguanylate cyclase (GGDEF)-like protein